MQIELRQTSYSNGKWVMNLSGLKIPIPRHTISDISHYRVEDLTDKRLVSIDKASYAGTTETGSYRGAWLYADFNPDHKYHVTVICDNAITEGKL